MTGLDGSALAKGPLVINQHLARGLFLAAVALSFVAVAARLPVGGLVRPGPGLFPLIVSSLLLALAVLTIIQSRFVASVPLEFKVRNIAMIILGLGLFVAGSMVVDMAVGITLMVFVAGFSARTYSWKRNLGISAGLITVAFAFQELLGLNLHLI